MPRRHMLALSFTGCFAGGLLLAACAAGPSGAQSASAQGNRNGGQCFNARMVSGFTPVDRDNVDIRVGPNRGFRLGLNGFCNDIRWADRVALRSRSGSFVCGALDAELVVPSVIGPQRCFVTSMRPLTEAELHPPRRRR